MKRALAVLAPAALVLGLASCMSSDDDDSPSDTEAASTAAARETEDTLDLGITIPDISIPDITLPDISIPDITIPDISFPDITIPDLSFPDISLPDMSDLTMPENMDELFAEAFPNLDEDQIDCLVENLEGNFDPQEAMQLMETCDIDPGDLIPG